MTRTIFDRMKVLIAICVALTICGAHIGFGPGKQNWGHVNVRKGAYMFWWLYYTTANVKNHTERPLVIWLQGGPGASSTGYGNFLEIGPLDLDLEARNWTWVKDVNLLFLDNPVGTGFSYTEENMQLANNNTQIAKDLVSAVKSFYEECPEFKEVPLYVMAESYGGKMAIEFVLLLDQQIADDGIDSNLVGVGLIDSWISPIDSVLTWAPYLLNTGIVDQSGFEAINNEAVKLKENLENDVFDNATIQFFKMESVVSRWTHHVNFYNILTKVEAPSSKHNCSRIQALNSKLGLLMNGPVKDALKVNSTFSIAKKVAVFQDLYKDFMKPVTHIVEDVLNNTNLRVAVVTGQLDLMVNTQGTLLWVDKLNWYRRKDWEKAERKGIVYNGIYEGYEKVVGNLGMYWVNRAGHMVPADNPDCMDYILRNLTNNYDSTVRRK